MTNTSIMHGVQIIKKFRWSMAHRLTHGYKGRCASLHGHEYEVGVTISGDVDDMGLIVDFGDVKRICGGWIKENFDHTTAVYEGDKTLLEFLVTEGQRHYVLPFNTTAENIAVYLRKRLQEALNQALDKELTVTRVTLMETPNSCVEVT
ncbi:MAG: 6-carboxytetrahydropterin synthase [Candidatus Marinimicrobia bacterium]|nr:6-carboxytetrahydropterin synthase [Candidatus Neomarinimicrobiota bacterium]